MNCDEVEKIFDYILMNKNIILSDSSIFNRDTLILLRDIIKNKKENIFLLSQDQENELIRVFINSNDVFDNDTPSFIMHNYQCIIAALERNIYSLDYISNIPKNLETRVLSLAIKNNYILNKMSPSFLRSNDIIAEKSIESNVETANYIDWDNISSYDTLISKLVKNNYVLSSNSPIKLKESLVITMSSIKRDIKTIIYASDEIRKNPEIFKYLVLNGYKFNNNELLKQPLSNFHHYNFLFL